MNFLPHDYVAPKGSSDNYMKIQDGENRFRILSSPIVGWEDWLDNKPIRFQMDEKPKASIDPKKPLRHFWAMIVWDYSDEKIKILQITQAGIRKPIKAYSDDKDWGAPFFYDLKVIRSGQKTDTEYSVMAVPGTPTPKHIRDAFYAKPIRLEALFQGDDPFAPGWDSYTDGVFEKPKQEPTAFDALSEHVSKANKLTKEQLENLNKYFEMDKEYETTLKAHYLKKKKVQNIEDISQDEYALICTAIEKRKADKQ